jgi:protein-S-isoprenylcysteine O-methyltransferase Ste14
VKYPSLPQIILLFFLGGVFLHFLLAGARTFDSKGADNDAGAAIAQSFVFTGTVAVWWLGLYQAIHLANGIAAALVLVSSVALYEWARHTIWGRRFGLAYGEHIPAELCEDGPYRIVRHPIYLSYLLAYLAALIALPHWVTAAIFVVYLGLLAHAARDDERRIDASPLAAEYAAYRERAGMLLPRLSRPAPGR